MRTSDREREREREGEGEGVSGMPGIEFVAGRFEDSASEATCYYHATVSFVPAGAGGFGEQVADLTCSSNPFLSSERRGGEWALEWSWGIALFTPSTVAQVMRGRGVYREGSAPSRAGPRTPGWGAGAGEGGGD